MSKNGQFSEREKEVTELLLQGKSNKQIALSLGISASTVEYHLTNIYKKLQANSRTEAVLQLGKSRGDIVTGDLGKSIVEMNGEKAENGIQSISTWRIPMNKIYAVIGGGLLIIVLVVILDLANKPVQVTEIASTAQNIFTSNPTLLPTTAKSDFSTSTPAAVEISLQPFEYIEYVVAPNDSCESIAANFNVPVEAILEKNNLSPSCTLSRGQTILLPFNPLPEHLFETSNNPPLEFIGEWVNVDLATANMARVVIQTKNGKTNINMFGVCQPTDCNFLEYSPAPVMDFNYDNGSGILNVVWVFDFETLTQELTITSDGQLKVITQNHYLDNSGRADFKTVEYFASSK
ncbi:MAG TPA: LuxR C-terminal-related transcriptional regulator [Anaerolineales bacterium]|nr:LuxR C-terminal-related transcriptional regulator [Anaerolineales bacterium]